MNALESKEIRLLLPAYGMALVLAVAPVWLLPTDSYRDPGVLALYAFCLGAVILALSSFGLEFGLRTFPLLLAQPLERTRLWGTKLAVLAGATLTTFGVWCISCEVCVYVGRGRLDWLDMLLIGGPAAMAVVASGLWTTLLLRQVVAAFWFAILVPGALAMVIGMNGGSIWAISIALGLYSIAGFYGAWRLFLRLQQVGWTGGTVTIPGWRSCDAALHPASRARRPIMALFWKELQLHQVGLAGMGALFVLHLGVLTVRKAGQFTLGEIVGTAVDLCGLIWLFVPLLIGSLSIADERRLGTLDTHLCLPVSSRVQFAIKLLFVVVIGGLLSAVLLWTAEGIGSAMGARSNLKLLFHGDACITFTLILMFLSLIAFYASTLTRNLLQALAAAAVMGIFFLMLMAGASEVLLVLGIWLWQGILVNLIGWPTLVATLLWLAYRNFRQRSETGRLWRRNVLGLTAALVFIAISTTAIYHRAWEYLTPLEPSHGPARLVGLKPDALRTFGYRRHLVLLPDGRVWEDRINPDWHDFEFGKSVFGESAWIRLGGRWISLTQNHFLDGTNWVDAVASDYETVGIRSDGTLWASEKPLRSFPEKGKLPVEQFDRLVRFGDQTNWLKTVWLRYNYAPEVLLLKRDGTLWRWRLDAINARYRPARPGLPSVEPQRLGTESDWAEIVHAGNRFCAWKKDGRAWVIYPSRQSLKSGVKELEPGLVIERWESLDKTKWLSLASSWPFQVGVREDGTLWAWRWYSPQKWEVDRGFSQQPVQIGPDTNWVSVAGDWLTLVALKSDGSLWRWNSRRDRRTGEYIPLTESPVRMGTHSDWVVVGNAWNGTVSLAADGSLWYWDSPYQWGSLFAASRRPIKVRNILTEASGSH